jgi:hypothetical protein
MEFVDSLHDPLGPLNTCLDYAVHDRSGKLKAFLSEMHN